MPKKKSVKKSVDDFKKEVGMIKGFLSSAEDSFKSDEYVSMCYDLAIIRLYRAFESLMLNALVGALNNDTSTLSANTGFSFPKHLTDEVCLYLVTRNGYFDFKGRDGLIKTLKQYLPESHYLVKIVSDKKYSEALEQLTAARNHAAHNSPQSRKAFKKASKRIKVGSAGSWLKTQGRFQAISDKLSDMANEIESNAPY